MELSFEITEDEMPIFLAETDEQLQLLDEGLLQLEREGESMELLQALFRAAHTLKGAAGMIAHKRMVSLTHAMETAFDGLRKQTYTATPALIDVCFESIDALRQLREEVVRGQASDIDIEKLTDKFSELVLMLTPGSEGAKSSAAVEKTASMPIVVVEAAQAGGTIYKVVANISPQSIASAARAFQIIMVLQEVGEIVHMDPSQAEVESARPVPVFTAHVKSQEPLQSLRQQLETVSEVDQLKVEQVEAESVAAHAEKVIAEKAEAAKVEARQAVGSKPAASAAVSKFSADKTVRTSVERLDNLMNLVGELITDRNRLHQIRGTFEARFRGDDEVDILGQTIAHISRITDQLQSEVMGIRMVPIANVFNKFPRMMRDLAAKLNKKMDLVIEGEDTELDRSLIELINDPLIHLLRNSIDHGVELPEKRISEGKSERARVLLAARYEQGRIIITVEDDGRGIDPQAVKEKALKKGVITELEARTMHDDEVINLIFNSGFSTAAVVSDVSGRGVGLDIVRNNIQRLNGSLSLESWAGKGTRFEVTLPLTLMIIQTLLVRIGASRLAIPLATVMSTLAVKESDIQTVNDKPVILLRNKVLPLLRLSKVFGFANSASSQENKYVVVVSVGKQEVGLLVDRLLGEEEVVVKSLGPLIGEIHGISSAAILGDGHVILIVDVPDLLKMASAGASRRQESEYETELEAELEDG